MTNNDLQANAETVGRKENRQRVASHNRVFRITLALGNSRGSIFHESLSQASDKVNFDEDTED
jgi:hypothetical protein